MPGSVNEDAELRLEEGLAAVSPERMGWFRYYFDDQRWEWSEQVQRMHGYQPGTITPTTELVLSHKHPDDRDQVAAIIDGITHSRGALSSRHRIIDTAGAVHWVVIIGDQFFDDDGAVNGTFGFYVDITPAERAREDIVTARLGEIAENRAPVEQAKGMLMLIYRINADSAFELLRWRSQETNTKLRALAEQIAKDFLKLSYDEVLPARAVYDRLLLTAHMRVGS